MTCVICDSFLSGRQTRACSKACKIQDDTNQRRESGRLRTANMTAEAREKKNARDRAWQEQLAPRQCRVCKETKLVRVTHSRTRLICKKCSPLWRGKTASASKDLVPSPMQPKTFLVIPPVTVIKGRRWTAGKCSVCNRPFISKYSDKTCSKACKTERDKDSRRWIDKKRRFAIYRRDQWICQLCFKPVDKSLAYDGRTYLPWLATLDHVLPRSLGGLHDDSNLRLAHWHCNSIRGADL